MAKKFKVADFQTNRNFKMKIKISLLSGDVFESKLIRGVLSISKYCVHTIKTTASFIPKYAIPLVFLLKLKLSFSASFLFS